MNNDRRRQVTRWALGLIAVSIAPAAIQAAFAPRSFFDDFPLGRSWISAGGAAYDEHTVRDVGALFLAMVIVTAWAAWRRQAQQAVAIAWLVQGVLHLTYHVGHLDDLGNADQVALVGSLVSVPALALVALWAGRASGNAGRP